MGTVVIIPKLKNTVNKFNIILRKSEDRVVSIDAIQVLESAAEMFDGYNFGSNLHTMVYNPCNYG